MKIYFRKNQLNLLHQIASASVEHSTFTLLLGKRKVGKTTLVKQFLRSQGGAYVTISSKSSYLQLQDLTEYLKSFSFTDSYIPRFQSWGNFFEFLFHIARSRTINVVIDEFHNFELIDPTAYSEFKRMWDMNASASKLNIIAISSNPEFTTKRFGSQDSDLYGLNNYTIRLTPFRLQEVISIFRLNGSELSINQIIAIYAVFGGLPKYYFLIERFKLWNSDLETIMRELIFMEYAPLAFELKELLINEFSRNYKIYLSILQAIANGHTKLSDIAKTVNIPVTNITKYLFELEKKRRIIKRKLPLYTLDDTKSKYGKYYIVNYFENFWFNFIQPDIISFEMGQYEKMLVAIRQKISGYINERMNIFVREILREHQSDKLIHDIFPYPISRVGSAWNRKFAVEIAAVDDSGKNVLYAKLITKDTPVTKFEVQTILHLFQNFDDSFIDHKTEHLIILTSELDNEAKIYCQEQKIKTVYLFELIELLNPDKHLTTDQIVEIMM